MNNLCEACEKALAAVTDDEIGENIESVDQTEQPLGGDTEDELEEPDVDQTLDLPEISTDGSNTGPSNQTPVTGEVILISDSEEEEIIVISDGDESNIKDA